MNRWHLVFGAAAALGGAIAVMIIVSRREAAQAKVVPDLIADCFDRIHRIEAELQRVNLGADAAI
jgi:hypothetical protein